MLKVDLTRIRCDDRPISDAPPQARKQASHWKLWYTTIVNGGAKIEQELGSDAVVGHCQFPYPELT